MKALYKLTLIAITAVTFASCGSATGPLMYTENPVGSKVGVASEKCFLNLCFNMDLSIGTAAKNGGIKKVATVDSRMKQGFLTVTYETVVTGE